MRPAGPDCSFKGGPPGFVRVTAGDELAFPDYDGNGMFKSLGNVLVNPSVGLLFIDMHGKPRRLRVNGEARVSRDDPLLAADGRRAADRAREGARHLPQLSALHPQAAAGSSRRNYVPQPGCEPVEPAWKGFDDFKDFVHPRQPTAKG